MPDSRSSEASSDEAERGRSVRRLVTLTARVGAAHAVLFLLTYWLVSDVPGRNATGAEVTDFYKSDDRRRIILAGLCVGPFAAMAFIWFLVALRMWVDSTNRVSVLLSNIQLVAGIVYVTLLSVAQPRTMQRKPIWPVEVSVVSPWRAAGR